MYKAEVSRGHSSQTLSCNGTDSGVGPNHREQGGATKLDMALNPNGGAHLSALNCIASPGHQRFGVEKSKPLCGTAQCGAACWVVWEGGFVKIRWSRGGV
jgi:hypothetical protein